jgi:phosphonatase-like hydrolase
MAIELVIFDIAGTTVSDENNVATAFQKAFALNDISIDREMVNPLMGYHKPQAIQMALEQVNQEFDADLIEEIHSDFEAEMIDFYEKDPSVKPIPGAEEIFEWLKKKNVKIALNTGFSAIIAEVIISRLQWEDKGLIDEYIGSDEVEKGRPYTYMINELMKRCKVSNPQAVAKVGDTPVDIEEGKNAGCRYVVAVTTGASSPPELLVCNPTHIIDHLSQLKTILF